MQNVYRNITVLVFILVQCSMSFSQDRDAITLYLAEANLEILLTTLEKQSDYKFSFIHEHLPDYTREYAYINQSIQEILIDALAETELAYAIFGQTITLYKVPPRDKSFRLYGYVFDEANGETILGAHLWTNSDITSTNEDGYYALTIDPRLDTFLEVSILGYGTKRFVVSKLPEGRHDLYLNMTETTLDIPIVIREYRDQVLIPNHIQVLRPQSFKGNKVITGQGDILAYLANIPFITKPTEGKSGYSVQGTSSDQNLILVDETPVYNPSHALGYLSVFKHSAINAAHFHKSYISPQFGGRVGSILDIRFKEGNQKKFAGDLTNNAFYSGGTLEGPIIEDKLSFIVSGRKSHANWVFNDRETTPGFFTPGEINFFDVHAKVNYKAGKNDRFYISTLLNQDEIIPKTIARDINGDGIGDQIDLVFGTAWKNQTFAARWDHVWKNDLISNVSFHYSNYQYGINHEFNPSQIGYREESRISNYNLKFDVKYKLAKNYSFVVGTDIKSHNFKPAEGYFNNKVTQINTPYQLEELWSIESALFAENQLRLGKKVKIDFGFRQSFFANLGNDHVEYLFNSKGVLIGEQFFKKGKIIRFFNGFEPRLSFQYAINNKHNIHFTYDRTNQYIFRLINENPAIPSEIWYSAGRYLKPQKGEAIHLKSEHRLSNHFKLSNEFYYRKVKNTNAFKNGVSLFSANFLDQIVIQGKMKSYGISTQLGYTFQNINGFVNIGLSKSQEQYDELNDGAFFSNAFDYPTSISALFTYQVNPSLKFRMNWQFRSGDLISLPTSVYYLNGFPIEEFEKRNNYRLPNYHRLDLSLDILVHQSKHVDVTLDLGAYNIYGKLNPYQVNIDHGRSESFLNLYALNRTMPFIQVNTHFK